MILFISWIVVTLMVGSVIALMLALPVWFLIYWMMLD